MTPNNFRFVNRMLNICYMTGVVRHDPQDKRRFYLSQTANPALDVPVSLTSPDFPLPPVGQLRTVMGHVRGRAGEYGQNAVVEAFSVGQSSVLTVNPMSSYLLGFAKRLPGKMMPETSPFTVSGQLKPEFIDQIKGIEDLRPEERAVIELYEEQSGKVRGRFDSNSNVVILAGVVDRFSYAPPNAFQRNGQGMVLLRQNRSLGEVIPIRVMNNRASVILEKLTRGATVHVKGRMRRKIMPTPDGTGILSDIVMVETDMISPADQAQILPPPPPWYAEYLKRENQPSQPTASISESAAAPIADDGDDDLDESAHGDRAG